MNEQEQWEEKVKAEWSEYDNGVFRSLHSTIDFIESLLTSRDTYWKERVRKFQRRMYKSQIKLYGGGQELFEEAVGKKDIYTAVHIWQNTITDAYNQALYDILAHLDITNEDNLK